MHVKRKPNHLAPGFLREPIVTRRGARVVIGFLLAVKLTLSLWNSYSFVQASYDDRVHKVRAATGGLSLKGIAYNPPLYYLGRVPPSKMSAR